MLWRLLLLLLLLPALSPRGPAGAVVLCLLPIAFLVVVTVVKQLLLPTSISLPAAALMLAFIRCADVGRPVLTGPHFQSLLWRKLGLTAD